MRATVFFIFIGFFFLFFLLGCGETPSEETEISLPSQAEVLELEDSGELEATESLEEIPDPVLSPKPDVSAVSSFSCLNPEFKLISPGNYVCRKGSEERRYILSEPGISNEAHLCEIDLIFGRNKKPVDWYARNEACFCRRTLLFDYIIKYIEQGYTCYKDLGDRKILIELEKRAETVFPQDETG